MFSQDRRKQLKESINNITNLEHGKKVTKKP